MMSTKHRCFCFIISVLWAVFLVSCSSAPRYTKKTQIAVSAETAQQKEKIIIQEPPETEAQQIVDKRTDDINDNSTADLQQSDTKYENSVESVVTFSQEGTATYYADKLQGRKTAYGERYNKKEFTAAHKKLPQNTMVKVTSLTNGKSVIVRINDRGPFTKNRIIDLSKAAAREIDMLAKGIMKVRLEVFEEK